MATVLKHETFEARSSEDIIRVRQAARALALQQGFGLVDQTKLVTAVSELTRNTVDFGGGGTVRVDVLNEQDRQGLRLTFVDQGPGIADVALAMKDGYSTGSGFGLGLSGSKRLVDEFEINSHAGKGTRVTITMWKR